MESSLGLMEKVIKVSMLKMKNKEKVDSIMEMVHIIKAIGLKEGNMEEENSEIKAVRFMKEDTNMDS